MMRKLLIFIPFTLPVFVVHSMEQHEYKQNISQGINNFVRCLPVELRALIIESSIKDRIIKRQFIALKNDIQNWKKISIQDPIDTQNHYSYNTLLIKNGILPNIINWMHEINQQQNMLPVSIYLIIHILLDDNDYLMSRLSNTYQKQLNKYYAKQRARQLLQTQLKLADVKGAIIQGADINLQDSFNQGSTLMMNAAAVGNLDIIKVFIAAGADINLQNYNGCTALMLATQNGYKDIVNTLIAADADVNLQDNWGRTALIIAISKSYQDIVKKLMETGVNEVLV